MRRALLVTALLAAGAVLASRYLPSVTTVDVFGNSHHSAAEVAALADVRPGDPFLWVTRFRVRRLAQDPWIARARVVRHWPDAITLSIVERTPLASDGATTWARDGKVLSGVVAEVRRKLIRIEGWGPPRLGEALELAALLEGRGVKVISYSPEGLEVQFAERSLFTPSVSEFREQWASFEQQRGRRLAVYPWGVSSSND